MRLLRWINQDQIGLTLDLDDDKRPAYAILSHTWALDNREEVTWAEVETPEGQNKLGYKKIRFCAEQARKDGISHFWVDTCCIDKTNHVELSEAITSMYRWYQNAAKCYVYLSDVEARTQGHISDAQSLWESSFRRSRWFTRGWTLQELLAPTIVEFYSGDGAFLGTKEALAAQIHEITTIPLAALRNTPLAQFPIDERIRWTQQRQTKKKEDQAYCLLGIFEVFIPCIYGEGDNAVRRLQKKINDRYGQNMVASLGGANQTRSLGLCFHSAPLIDPAEFVGRAPELANIHAILRPDEVHEGQKRVVLGGIGGIGKTQLAIAYARQHQQSYASLLWLNAATESTLYAGLMLVAQAISIEQLDTLTSQQVLASVLKWLSRPDNRRWLLILDNYDEPDLFAINDFCPGVGHGSIIITTRLPDLVMGTTVRVQPLATILDSLDMLEIRSGRLHVQEDVGAQRLATRLDGFPLALVTAGAFLRKNAITFQQYLDAYEQKWHANQRRPLQLLDYQDRTLYTTWNLSYARLQEEDPDAARMLRLLAYFDNRDVWYELLLTRVSDDLAEWLLRVLEERTTFDSIMSTLVEYCFVEVQHTSQSYSMHNCVHDWVLGELNVEISPSLYWYAFDCVRSSIDDNEWDALGVVKYARISRHGMRLAHVSFRKCDQLSDGLLERLEDAAWIAAMLKSQVQLLAAEQMYLRALAGYETALGPNHTSTLNTVGNLGNLYRDQGKLEQAEQMYLRALAGYETALGPDHTSTLTTVNNLGNLYADQGKLDQAELMYQRALAGYGTALGPDHTSTLTTVNNLGNLYADQGKLDQAELMYQRALAGYETALGPDHTSTLNTVNNLGALYADQGKLEQAELMYQRALTGYETALGPDHTSTLDTVNNLGLLYANQGKLQQAELMYQRALAGYETALGPDHTSTLNTINNLGVLYHDQGKLQQAEQMFLRALAGYEAALGPDHTSTLRIVNNLANIHSMCGKADWAEQMYLRALHGHESALSPQSRATLDVVNNLGLFYERQCQFQMAEKMYRRSLHGNKAALGSDHISTLNTAKRLRDLHASRDQAGNTKQMYAGLPPERPAMMAPSFFTLIKHAVVTADNRDRSYPLNNLNIDNEDKSDTISEYSQTSSVQSLPSLISDLSSTSIGEEVSIHATEHMANMLQEDSQLIPLYKTAVAKFRPQNFQAYHDQLLKLFFNELRDEVETANQLVTVRILRNHECRRNITRHIQTSFASYAFQVPQMSSNRRIQKTQTSRLLNGILEQQSVMGKRHVLVSSNRNQVPSKYNANTPVNENESEEDEVESHNSDEQTTTKPSHIELLERFVTTGQAFERFKTRLNYLLNPPATISEALSSTDAYIVQRFLSKNFDQVASGNYEWLRDVADIGYTFHDMATLLLENVIDSPWIYFDAQEFSQGNVNHEYHVPDCIHRYASDNTSEPHNTLASTIATLTLHQNDIWKQVQSLCGLGGVVPSSRDANAWLGYATFEEGAAISSITLDRETSMDQQDSVDRLIRILRNFCTAVAVVQEAGLCCNSFTALVKAHGRLQLRCIEFRYAQAMMSCLESAVSDDNMEAGIKRAALRGIEILAIAGLVFPSYTDDTGLHFCALATQFLCVAFVSYTQAHIGPLDFFFLETPQQKISMHGNQSYAQGCSVLAELANLSCLAEMTQHAVLAFSSTSTRNDSDFDVDVDTNSRYDVYAGVAECLDTWGPGYLIHRPSQPKHLEALAVNGGYLFPVNEDASRFHWGKELPPDNDHAYTFTLSARMQIGAIVSTNQQCSVDEIKMRGICCNMLQHLGTCRSYWEPRERQAGLQAGQYVNVTYIQASKKVRGTTLKEKLLESNDAQLVHCLEERWGLQVSLCTSVAHRVTLRELVRDILPTFRDDLRGSDWQEILHTHDIISALTNGNLFDWVRNLPSYLQSYVLSLIRTILGQLAYTGMDRTNKFLIVAWSVVGDCTRGLRLPCIGDTCWAQILADADDCATFAYVTRKCLETVHIKCSGSLGISQNLSKSLVTNVCPNHTERAFVDTTGTATLDARLAAISAWKLEDQKVYYVRKMDNILQFKAERAGPQMSGSIHLVVSGRKFSSMTAAYWRRFLSTEARRGHYQIREKQAEDDHAEGVIVKARSA